jgi:uncharacterized membrane protein
MKRLGTVMGCLSLALILAALGCEAKSPPGGPGATSRGADTSHSSIPMVGQPDNTFKLDVPALATSLKQGETKTITLSISRGKNFDQDVKLEFSDAPQGVKVTPTENSIKHGDKEVQVKLEAAKDAALGEHTITVTGLPAKEGAKTSVTFKIDVKKAG